MSSKVILVTGASKGMGLALTALLLSQAEARKITVVGTGRSVFPEIKRFYENQLLDKNQDLLHKRNYFPNLKTNPSFEKFERLFKEPNFFYYRADLGIPEMDYNQLDGEDHGTVCALVRMILTRHGRLDAVIHNAGVIDPISKISTLDLHAFRKIVDINLFSSARLAKASISAMKLNKPDANGKQGSFILVSSGAAIKPRQGWGSYCITKAACNMLVASMGLEEPSLYSLAVRPGVVDTDMQTSIRSDGAEAMGERNHKTFVDLKEQGKLLHPLEPGSVYAALALSESGAIEPEINIPSGSFSSWDDPSLIKLRNKVFGSE